MKISILMKKIIQNLKNQMSTHYSLVLVPNTGHQIFQIRIRKLIFHLAAVLIIIISVYSAIMTAAHMKMGNDIKKNTEEINRYLSANSQQEAYIKQLNEQLETINEKVAYLKSLESQAKSLSKQKEK